MSVQRKVYERARAKKEQIPEGRNEEYRSVASPLDS